MHSDIRFVKNMTFIAKGDANYSIVMDTEKQFGGDESGITPKELLLHGLGGCTGMDVVSLLKKMKVDFNSFEIKIHSDLTDEHPKILQNICLIYYFTADSLEQQDKIIKAVTLSQERYCGVSAMLEKATNGLKYEIFINNEKVK